ncbi:MAG TPA: nitronate monooxygenase [Caldimonas sp.]|jgi:nitronate monooxygenase|nr:nitronate monooxygenase [Caldimonas sp.]HEX2540549.1 nitronate monooxygenase [Caldimonas sp.]
MSHAFLGVDLPVVQAPMAGAQGSALAIAVSRAGGLGSLPCAMLEPEAMRAELAAIRAATDRPFNVNFFCHAQPAADADREAGWRAALAPYYREYGIDPQDIPAAPGRLPFSAAAAEVLDAVRPPVVSFHFGLPEAALRARVRALGALILATATTVDEALWLERHGVDAIVAQGWEAGGHRGHFLSDDLLLQPGTLALVPQVVRAVRVPVIAAGGIADAAGVRAVLALGAVAAQVGTAYLLCPEATTHPAHRAALVGPMAQRTAVTNLYTGRPARGIENRLMREIGPLSPLAPAFPLATAALAPLRTAALKDGKADFMPLWCGQNASGCRPVPAAELTHGLAGV